MGLADGLRRGWPAGLMARWRRDREDFESLPPSCRAVIRELEHAGGELTRQELIDRTGHSDSTITDALRNLENRCWILRARDSEDLNHTIIEIRCSPES